MGHPGKPTTWNLKVTPWKRNIIFQTSIIVFQVSEQACAMLRDGILSSAPSERRACLVREVTIRDRGPGWPNGM